MEKRVRNFCFTLNNYTQVEYDLFSIPNKQVRYIILGKEKGELEETPHLQGFMIFYNQKSFHQALDFFKKNYSERVHLEKTEGTIASNIAYCSKDENYIEVGVTPDVQGSRKDLDEVRALIQAGANMRDISEACRSFQSLKMAESLMKYQPHPQVKKRMIKWYYGTTGSGKTRSAIEESGGDYYITMKDLKWWDGYYGQKVVIIDDFRKDFCTFHELLRITDRYPYRVQAKGTSMWLAPTTETIIITSAFHPDSVYHTREDIGQLIRRIDLIKEFFSPLYSIQNKNPNGQIQQIEKSQIQEDPQIISSSEESISADYSGSIPNVNG